MNIEYKKPYTANDWPEKKSLPFPFSIHHSVLDVGRSMFNMEVHVILEPASAGIVVLSVRDGKPIDFKFDGVVDSVDFEKFDLLRRSSEAVSSSARSESKLTCVHLEQQRSGAAGQLQTEVYRDLNIYAE